MSDNNLRLQVILNAVDKLTRPFRSAQASSRELAAAVKKSRDAIKQLDQAGSSLDSFRKLQAENQKLGDRLNYARQRANLLSQELGAMGPPSQRQVVALGRQRLAVQRLEERQKKLQQQTALVRAELYRAGISAKDDAGATARLARETSRYNQELSKQEARLKRLGEAQRRMNAARASYARSLEVRDRIAGAGATTTAAGLAMGAPVMAAVKSYTSMEDAMKGVAKQVNGLRDDNGNRTARFYEMQDAIKAASEQLPMENGAVDFAALVEGGARMNVANPDDSWEDQKRDLLAFASTAAKAATAFELPADELSESLGKIAQLYKIPTRNIEQLGDALNYLDDNAMSKGADIIDVMQRLGGVADRLDYRKAAALGSTFLTLGAAPEVAASAANAMVRELSIATMQSKSFFEGMNLLKLNPEVIEKQMTKDAMGTIQRVLEKVNALPQDKRLSAMTMLFGKEFGDDAAKLANNLPELQRQLKLTAGNDALGSMQKEPAKKESTTVKRKRRTKKQKKEPEAKQGDYLVGTDENVLVLNRTYANRSNAERAAKMQWERLQRGVASFSLQLAEGRADLYTEMPVKVSGFKQPIDDAEWTITTLTHTVSPDNGFTTSLELEVRIDDFEME